MQCISVMSIPRPNGRGNTDRISVPCGKCPVCLSNRRSSWAFRLEEELKKAETASFITLTYDEDNVPIVKNKFTYDQESLSKIDVQGFLKRLRERCYKVDTMYNQRLDRLKLRYFLTGEYGSQTLRPHYHALIFNLPVMTEMELYSLIGRTWKKGNSYIGTVTPASISYVAKYLLKGSMTPQGCEEPFSLMSRRPGIGYEYVKRMSDWHQDDQRFYVQKNNIKQSMPKYYKDKIFSKTDKEENNLKMIPEIDRIENEKLYNTFAKGVNPFEQEMLCKDDLSRKIKNLTKNDKL